MIRTRDWGFELLVTLCRPTCALYPWVAFNSAKWHHPIYKQRWNCGDFAISYDEDDNGLQPEDDINRPTCHSKWEERRYWLDPPVIDEVKGEVLKEPSRKLVKKRIIATRSEVKHCIPEIVLKKVYEKRDIRRWNAVNIVRLAETNSGPVCASPVWWNPICCGQLRIVNSGFGIPWSYSSMQPTNSCLAKTGLWCIASIQESDTLLHEILAQQCAEKCGIYRSAVLQKKW